MKYQTLHARKLSLSLPLDCRRVPNESPAISIIPQTAFHEVWLILHESCLSLRPWAEQTPAPTHCSKYLPFVNKHLQH